MGQPTSSIQDQYEHGSLLEAIDLALEEADLSKEAPTVEDLAPVDGFHIRGRQATRELLRDLSLPEDPYVLDVGCGIGGTARFLADEYGARVLGVDLCQEYCEVARDLTRRVGMDDRVEFRQGTVLDLPVQEDRFDLVVSEHVQMNVSEKRHYVQEIARVLQPGGVLAFYEIFAGPEEGQYYPVPWADGPSVSFLAAPKAFRETVAEAGLEVLKWQDDTEEGLAWFERMLEKVRRDGPPPMGLHLLMGASTTEKMRNVVRNLRENRIVIVAASARKQT